jgi:1-acyl-sn-glycerol-3-phosphate acyltransferase
LTLALSRHLPARPGQRVAAIAEWWHTSLCQILDLRIEIHGEPLDGPCLLVANHVSWLDPICLSTVRPLRFLANGGVRQRPLIRWLAARLGTHFLAGGAVGAETAAAQAMRAGHAVAMFPEGTTSDGIAVRRFHAPLFQAAILAEVPVQPVAIRYREAGERSTRAPFLGEDTLLAHLWRLAATPGMVVEIAFLSPIYAGRASAPQALAQRARGQVDRVVWDLRELPRIAQVC